MLYSTEEKDGIGHHQLCVVKSSTIWVLMLCGES